MEVILVVILAFAAWIIFVIFSAVARRTIGSAAKAVSGEGTFSENLGMAFRGMGPMEARIVDTTLGDDGMGAPVKAIEVKGLFPVNSTRRVSFVTSIFDETGGEREPVLSAIDIYQEPDSTVYQHSIKIGQEVSPEQGFGRWTRAGRIFPNVLQPPVGGARRLSAILRLVDTKDMPVIRHGSNDPDGTGILWQAVLNFEFTFVEKGYEEAAEHRDHARALSVKIGMAVAMADGTLDDSEGETLKDWILKSISPYADKKREHLKAVYDDAMKDAHSLARNGALDLDELTRELNEIAEQATKYETIALCFDVMAADGVVAPEELKVINKVADALDLDFEEIEKMRDQKIISLGANVDSHASIEKMLAIDATWPAERIKSHLGKEFEEWTDRFNTAPEGEERDKARKMLDLIADARKNMTGIASAAHAMAEKVRYDEDASRPATGGDPSATDRTANQVYRDGLRISPVATPSLANGLKLVCQRLQIPEGAVEAFIFASPDLKTECHAAGPSGCVLRFSSSLVNLLDDQEFEFVAGHEIGHFLLGHRIAKPESHGEGPDDLIERRRQDISADRIGLIACQKPETAIGAVMKTVSGLSGEHPRFDVGAFISHLEDGQDGQDGQHDGVQFAHRPASLLRCRALLWFSRNDFFAQGAGDFNEAQMTRLDQRIGNDFSRFLEHFE